MILQMSGVSASYGPTRVLSGIDVAVADGEIVALLGRNGMGKTTTLNSIVGLADLTGGRIAFAGEEIGSMPTYRVARRGIALVPEGRQIFPNLSVEENLVATASNPCRVARPWRLDDVYDLFPALHPIRDRAGGVLSGGEQQMLAIGRALMTNPLLLMLDEATEGLAPKIRAEIWRVMGRLRDRRQSVLIVDKNIRALSEIADRYYVVEKGRTVRSGQLTNPSERAELESRFLGVR